MTKKERDVAILFITDHLIKLDDKLLDIIIDMIIDSAAEFDNN